VTSVSERRGSGQWRLGICSPASSAAPNGPGRGIRGCGNREVGMGKIMEAWGSLYLTNSSSVARIGAEL
jgi:hypothetical protein